MHTNTCIEVGEADTLLYCHLLRSRPHAGASCNCTACSTRRPKEVRSLANNYLRPDAVKISIGGGADKLVANKVRAIADRRPGD